MKVLRFQANFRQFSAIVMACGLILATVGTSVPQASALYLSDVVLDRYAFIFGGGNYTEANASVVDNDQNFYVGGRITRDTDLNPGSGTDVHTASGSSISSFISKFAPDGSYVWGKTFSGESSSVQAISYDSSGDIYVAGFYSGTVDFNPGAGVDNHTSAGGTGGDAFVAKLNSDGSFAWARTFGNTESTSVLGMVVGSDDTIYLGGICGGIVDFDPGASVDSHTCRGIFSSGGRASYLSKFNSDGSYEWARTFGGVSNSDGIAVNALDIDGQDNVYMGGYMFGSVNFDPNLDPAFASYTDGSFVSKFSPDGVLERVSTFGGTVKDIAVDRDGNVYTAGSFIGTADFDPGVGVDERTSRDGSHSDAFVTKLSSAGDYLWALAFAGEGAVSDSVQTLAIDVDGGLYAGGRLNTRTDFDSGPGVGVLEPVNGQSSYVVKYSQDGDFSWAKALTGADYLMAISPGTDGSLYLSGWFNGSTDLDPGTSVDEFTTLNTYDAFVSKLKLDLTQNITSLRAGLISRRTDTLQNIGTGNPGVAPGETKQVRLYSGVIPLAETNVTFSGDLSWSGVDGSVDGANYRSVVKGFGDAPGTAATHSLFVPKAANHDAVAICPYADTVDEVTLNCAGRVVYTESSSLASVVTIGSATYWKVDGLTGTGGLSYQQTATIYPAYYRSLSVNEASDEGAGTGNTDDAELAEADSGADTNSNTRKSKNSLSDDATDNASRDAAAQTADSQNSSVVMYVVTGTIGVFFVGFLLFFLARRRKHEEE